MDFECKALALREIILFSDLLHEDNKLPTILLKPVYNQAIGHLNLAKDVFKVLIVLVIPYLELKVSNLEDKVILDLLTLNPLELAIIDRSNNL